MKCLRTPSAIFIAGLTSANLLTGLIAEPAFVGMVMLSVLYDKKEVRRFYRFTEIFSLVTMTSSFLIMLALGIVQYLLIKHPRVYQKSVSPRSAVIGTIFIFFYSIFFAVLPDITGTDKFLNYFVDLVIHETLLTVVLVILYIMIYRAFRKLAQRHRDADLRKNTEEQEPSVEQTESEQQRRQAENDFVYGTIILTAVLIITVWPFCIVNYLTVFHEASEGILIALVISYFFFLWKFTVDPFVFAWRLRKYRKSLVLVVQGTCPCCKPSGPGAIYHRQGSRMAVPQSEIDDNDHDVQVTVVDGSDSTHLQAAIM